MTSGRAVGTVPSMAHPVVEQLAEPYVVALVLVAADVGVEGIAAHLDIPCASVQPLLDLARAKLARVLADEAAAGP